MAADTAKLIASLELVDKFTKPLANATRGLSAFDKKMGETEGRAFKAGQQIGTGFKNAAKIIAAATVAVGIAGTGLLIASIGSARDLSETISKVGVVFGAQGERIRAFGKTSAAALGLSENAALSAAATYGNLFVSMGLAQDKAADMSVKLVTLAGDLASFNNIDPTEALEKLRAGLTGESEPLKTLGININETIIKQKALALGIVDVDKKTGKFTGTLTAAQKAQAAYALIFEQSTTAQGDFARTQSGLANQTRILKANWENLKATLATPVLPRVAKIFEQINKAVVANGPAIAKVGDKIADLFSDKNIADGANVIKGVFTTMQSLLPAIQAGAEVTGKVITTAVNAFKSLPPEIQALAVAGLAINKLTGGLVTNIAGGLISAVISSFKGLMNVNAATVIVHGAALSGPGLIGDVTKGGAAVSRASQALSLVSKVFVVGMAAEVAELISGPITDLGKEIHNQIFGPGKNPLSDFGDMLLDLEWPFGPKNAPEWAGGKPTPPAVKNAMQRAAFGPPNSEPLGPPTSVAKGALGALTGALTGAARATKAYTSASILAGRSIQQLREQEKAARGSQTRIGFLATGKPSATVPVADYLTRQFAVSQAPFYRNMDNAKRALDAIKADQRKAIRLGDFGTARKLGKDLDALQATIKANKPVVNVTVPVNNYVNGRILGAGVLRFTSTVGNLGRVSTVGGFGGH